MTNAVKNLLVVLVIIIAAFVVYSVVSQEAALSLRTVESDTQLQNLLANAEEFTQRQIVLDRVTMDTSILTDEVFLSLRSFSTDTQGFQVGRDNPFLPTRANQAIENNPLSE